MSKIPLPVKPSPPTLKKSQSGSNLTSPRNKDDRPLSSRIPQQKKVLADAEYLISHDVHHLFNQLANGILQDKPQNVVKYLKNHFNQADENVVVGKAPLPPKPQASATPTLPTPTPPYRPSQDYLSSSYPNPLEHYQVKELICKKPCTSVYKATTKSGEVVAIKKVKVDGPWVEAEYNNLLYCAGPCVVECRGCYYNRTEDTIWIVMEYLPYTLEKMTKTTIKEPAVIKILFQVTSILVHIHSKGRAHLDLSLSNVLYEKDDQLKIGDFGTMATIGDTSSELGDLAYIAPEVILDGAFTEKSDIWSLGILALALADRRPPLDEEDPDTVMKVFSKKCLVPTFLSPHLWSSALKDFVSKCLRYDPSKRPSAQDLLKHDLFKPK